jgi:ABC-2 type transport system permease protein
MTEAAITLATKPMKRFRSPQTVIGRFVAKRTYRSATLWALVFAGFMASKAISFVNAYPTEAARSKIAASFSNNVGVEVILGPIRHATTVGSLVSWNTLMVMIIIGSVWALLLATKVFRGEENAGRAELLLSGQTTARRAAVNILAGLSASLIVFYIVSALTFSLVGKAHGVGFDTKAAAFFALAVICGIYLFMMVGALASQLMPTRSRAASVSVAVFGICFILRAVGDITSAHWILDITPLGWIEKMQPLYSSQPIWLWPLVALIVILSCLTVYYAGRRDLGASMFADKDTAKAHTKLLNSVYTIAIRLTRAINLTWLLAIGVSTVIYGSLTHSFSQALGQSNKLEKIISKVDHQTHLATVLAFLGIIFFLQMIIMMCYAASSANAIRRDEAEGYVDNLLVRPVSRIQWLMGRISLILIVIMLAGFLVGGGTWLATIGQHSSLSFYTLIKAGANAIIPVLFILGAGIFTFGIHPRLTSLLAYGLIAWSFLIDMISSGIHLNNWILDTSILNHVVFAPAAAPDWSTNLIIIGIALVLGAIGVIGFNKRDLASE